MTRSTLPEGRRRVALESIGIIPVNVAGAGAGLASLASGIGRLADGVAEADGVRQREQAAQQADSSVTRDAEGNIAIADNPFSDPRARSIFQGQQRQRYLAEIGTDAKRAATDLHVANPLDPAAFDAAWQGRTEGTLAQVPPAFREDARRTLAELGTTHRNGIAVAQAENAKAMAAKSFNAELETAGGDYLSLAQAGKHNDPEFLARFARLNDILLRGVDNQFLTPEKADLFRRQFADQAEGLGVAAVAESAYRAAGRGAAGVAAAYKVVTEGISGNPDSSLKLTDKNALEAEAMQRVRGLEALREGEVREARAVAQVDFERLKLGVAVPLTTLDAHRSRLLAAGDIEEAAKTTRIIETAREIRATALLPVSQMTGRIDELESRMRAGTASAVEADAYRQLVDIRATKSRALAEDALTWGSRAHRDLIGDLPPLEFRDPDKLAAAVARRMQQANTIAQLEERPVAPFTMPELAQIAGLASTRASPAEQLDFLARVTVDLKDDAAANIVLGALARNGFEDRMGGMRVALDIWETGDRNRARRVWGELSIPDKDIPIAATVDKTVKQSVDAEYRSGPGAVLDAAYLATGDARFAKRIKDEIEAATKIARVRAATGGNTRTADGALSDLFGDRRGIAERGFAAVTYPAATDRNALEAGLRAVRSEAVSAAAESIADPLGRREFERVTRDATWINLGDGYTLTPPGSGAPMRGPDGREFRVSLDDLLARGRADMAAERAAVVPVPGAREAMAERARAQAADAQPSSVRQRREARKNAGATE
jgi:hypothetical protein